MWHLECSQCFFNICSSDLLFDKLDSDFVKDIILSKSDVDKANIVASQKFTRFFYDLT